MTRSRTGMWAAMVRGPIVHDERGRRRALTKPGILELGIALILTANGDDRALRLCKRHYIVDIPAAVALAVVAYLVAQRYGRRLANLSAPR